MIGLYHPLPAILRKSGILEKNMCLLMCLRSASQANLRIFRLTGEAASKRRSRLRGSPRFVPA